MHVSKPKKKKNKNKKIAEMKMVTITAIVQSVAIACTIPFRKKNEQLYYVLLTFYRLLSVTHFGFFLLHTMASKQIKTKPCVALHCVCV